MTRRPGVRRPANRVHSPIGQRWTRRRDLDDRAAGRFSRARAFLAPVDVVGGVQSLPVDPDGWLAIPAGNDR